MGARRRWVLIAMMLCCLGIAHVQAQGDTAAYRLTIQIHEAPQFYSYYLFYFNNFELARQDDPVKNRTVAFIIPKDEEDIGGISAYPAENTSTVRMEQEETSQGTRITLTTDASGVELRYFQPVRAQVLKSDDQLLTFYAPTLESPVRGITIAINWPNWKYQIHKIRPGGAEMIMNPIFEPDPYKGVSYYWYFSGSSAAQEAPGEISVTLRSGATAARVTRNQTILILVAVVCIPTAIFVAINPPRRGQIKKGEKRFRITDERTRRRQIKRGRYKVR